MSEKDKLEENGQEELKDKVQNEESSSEQSEGGAEETEEDVIAGLQNDVGVAKDKYLRLFAEFDNYRKRTTREKADIVKSGGSKVIKSMLSVMDDLERALRINEDENEAHHNEGFVLIYQKMMKELEKHGVKRMDSMGKPFDASYNEAISELEVEEEEKKGTVVGVVEEGYYLHDKIIRYAKVVVGK